MSFSLREALLVALAAALALGSHACSLREQAPAAKLSLKDSQGCLDTAGQKLDRYFDGKTTDEEVASFWDCVDKSLETFSERTRGTNLAHYSKAELQRFFQDYFVKEFKLTDDLIGRILELKQFLAGGALDGVTRGELSRLRELVAIFKAEALKLRPFMPILPSRVASEEMKQVSVEKLEQALGALSTSGSLLGAELTRAQRGYRFSQLRGLLDALQDAPSTTSTPRPQSATLAKFIARLEFAELAHHHLFVDEKGQAGQGDSDWITQGGQGESLLKQLIEYYSALVRSSHLFLAHPNVHFGAGKERMKQIAQAWITKLMAATQGHAKQQISFEDLEAMLDAIPQEDLPLSRETIRSLIRPVIQRYLGGLDFTSTGRLAKGLHPKALERVSETFRDWYAGQTYLEGLYRALGADPEIKTHAGFEPEPLLVKRPEDLFPAPVAQALSPSALRLSGVIRGSRPLFAPGTSRIRLSAKIYDEAWRSGVEDRKHSFDGLSRMNWVQVLVRLLERGYVSKASQLEDQLEGGVTRSELNEFFEHVRPLLDELKLLDKKDPNVVNKRFNEGNYFMFSGNGDDRLSEREARELLSFILSGRSLCNEIHERVQKACLAESPSLVGPKDEFDFMMIDSRCHRRRFWQEVRSPGVFQGLPGFEQYLNQLPADQSRRTQVAYEFAARKSGYTDEKRVGGNDADGYSALAQYVEAAFLTFDRNLDGYIEPAEVYPEKYMKPEDLDSGPSSRRLGVFQRFKKIIGEVAESDNELVQEAVLHFMLERGRAPKSPSVNPADMMYALGYTKAKLWNYRADRGRILMLFAVMGAGNKPLPPEMLE